MSAATRVVASAAPAASRDRRVLPGSRDRRVLLAAVALAVVAGFAAGHAPPLRNTEPALLNLLRFMAVVKLAMAAGAAWLVHWRLARPASTPAIGGAIAAVCAMAVAPGLIWGMAHVLLAAALFHAGLLGLLALAWAERARTA